MQIKRNDTYDDILSMERPISRKRKPMSMRDRAAQFAPFAALTGHEDAVKETARLTETRIELDESEVELLNQKLQYLAKQMDLPLDERSVAAITYFVSDLRKSGGEYVECKGRVKKINTLAHQLIMEDGAEISVEDILRINLEISP